MNRIVNGKQSKHQIIMDQRERIRKIYNPTNLGLKSCSSNIMVSDEFPSIKNKNGKNGMNSSFNSGSRLKSRHSSNMKESHSKEFINNTGEWKVNQYSDQVINPLSEGLLGNTNGKREAPICAEETSKIPRNDVASHSLIGNLSGKGKLITGASSQDVSTVSINTKKNNLQNGYEQSITNMIKYDTTAVISEEFYSNDDRLTHMLMNNQNE